MDLALNYFRRETSGMEATNLLMAMEAVVVNELHYRQDARHNRQTHNIGE